MVRWRRSSRLAKRRRWDWKRIWQLVGCRVGLFAGLSCFRGSRLNPRHSLAYGGLDMRGPITVSYQHRAYLTGSGSDSESSYQTSQHVIKLNCVRINYEDMIMVRNGMQLTFTKPCPSYSESVVCSSDCSYYGHQGFERK